MPKEAVVLKQCKELLTLLQTRGDLCFKRVHTTAVPINSKSYTGKGRFRKNEGVGLPDLLVFLPKGKLLCIECKSDSGRLQASQKAFCELLTRYGHHYYITRSLADLIAILCENGVHV